MTNEKLGPGKITLSFYVLEGSHLTELRSRKDEYPSIAAARAKAIEALEKFPHISYAHINFTPTGGHIRSVERIDRRPLF